MLRIALATTLFLTAFSAEAADKKKRAPIDRTAAKAHYATFAPKYEQHQCIVKTEIRFSPKKTARLQHAMRQEFARFLYEVEPKAAVYRFAETPDGYTYFIYADDCERRVEVTEGAAKAIGDWFEGAVSMTVFPDEIHPGPNTIEVMSMEWTDANPE